MSSNPFDPGSASENPNGGEGDAPAVEMEVGALFNRCLEIFQNNPGIILAAILLPVIPAVLLGGADVAVQLSMDMSEDEGTKLLLSLASLGLSLTSTLVSLFFSLGQISIFLGLVRGEEVDLNMLVSGGPYYLGGLVASLLLGIAVFSGTLLCIVPGIILWAGLQFTLYALVDRDLGPVEALSESWNLTEGFKLTILLINIVVIVGLLVFSCITMGIGYFVAVPVLSLMQAVMYHSLVSQRNGQF